MLLAIVLLAAGIAIVETPERASAYTFHNPIWIDGNGGFTAANGVTGGTGTSADPYVIEGWELPVAGAAGIVIENTDAHLVIRNVYVHPGGEIYQGIALANVTNATIAMSRIVDADIGLLIGSSPGVVVHANDIISADYNGIMLGDSRNATVVGNNISSRNTGIAVYLSPDTVITANVISSNPLGILLGSQDPGRVRVFHNDMISNAIQAWDGSSPLNSWDDGYPSGGNFWSDYSGVDNCSGPAQDVCPSLDGIGDTPYVTDGGRIVDRFPLMTSYVDVVPPTIAVDSPSDGAIVFAPFVTFQGTASDGSGTGVARVEVRVNGGAWRAAVGRTSWSASVTLAFGHNVLEARAWDYGGNPSAIATLNARYVIAPIVTISSPSNLDVVTQRILTVSGTATDATVVQVQVDGGMWQVAAGTQSWSLTVGPLGNGAHTIRAQGLNDTVPSAIVSVAIFVDLPDPTLDVLTPAEGEEGESTFVLSGTATPGASVELRSDGGAWIGIAVAGPSGSWSFSWDAATVGYGSHTLEFKASKDDRDSPVVTRHVTVIRIVGVNPTPEFPFAAALVTLILAIAGLSAILLWVRRRRGAAAPATDSEDAARR